MNVRKHIVKHNISAMEKLFSGYINGRLQISPGRCGGFASDGVSVLVPAVWLLRMNGAFRV